MTQRTCPIHRRPGTLAALGCVLLAGCAGAGRAVAPEEDSAQALRARFQQAVDTFRAQQRPGGAPDAPGLIRLASRMLAAHAVGHSFSGNPGDLALTLEPSLGTGLNRLALQVRDTVKGRVVYDVGRFLKDPGAPTHFDPQAGVLFLPHAALLQLDADEPTVRHELVHVRTFGTLRSGWLAPFQGYALVPQLGEEALFLDEIPAYLEDIRFAALQLAELLRRDPEPAGRLAREDLGELLRIRIAGEKPQRRLSLLEQIWDRLLARTLYGGTLAAATAEALLPLERLAREPDNVEYVHTPDGTVARLLGRLERGNTRPVLARFYLPSSTGVADPKNAQILTRQLTSTQQAAQAHADQFARAKAMFHAVVDEVSPARRAQLLLSPGRIAGEP